MNNLKFRAWDKTKEIFTNYQIVDDMLYFMDKFTGVWIRDDNQDRFAIMQSTGLKDKNGKEIFEGDIVNCGYLFNGSPFDELDEYEEEKGVVKFLNCGFNIKFKNDTYLFIDIMGSCEDIEVVGNIYDNRRIKKEKR